ncbi:MAG: hypothetical protein ACK4FJ_18040 [Ferrovibrio sp.]|uniref:hypothetical protein n=1 Tax=Ferrovibrio sp. TaxID=1917215 RepID=UPI00391ADD2B
MTSNSDILAIVSALIAAVSLVLNFYTYAMRRELEKTAEIARLHGIWWADGMKARRERTHKIIKEWEKSGKEPNDLLKSYATGVGFDAEKNDIGVIAYFFSDLCAMLDEGLASKKFAYRLFAKSQFYYFSDFLLAAADKLESSLESGGQRRPRWIDDVRKLHVVFRAMDGKTQAIGQWEYKKIGMLIVILGGVLAALIAFNYYEVGEVLWATMYSGIVLMALFVMSFWLSARA